MKLPIIDYICIIGYVGFIIAFGCHFAKQQKSTKNYFLAGKSMGWFPLAVSMYATLFSSISYVMAPAEAFRHDLQFLMCLDRLTYKIKRILPLTGTSCQYGPDAFAPYPTLFAASAHQTLFFVTFNNSFRYPAKFNIRRVFYQIAIEQFEFLSSESIQSLAFFLNAVYIDIGNDHCFDVLLWH